MKSNQRGFQTRPWGRGAAAAMLLGSILSVLAATGCGRHSGLEAPAGTPAAGQTLRIGYPGNGSHGHLRGPEGWALQQGILLPYLKPFGFTAVQLVNLPNGPDINEALAAKGVDLGIYGDAPAVLGRGVGIPIRCIDISSIDGNSYLYTTQQGPKSVQDLVGKTVGTQKGSVMGRFLLQELAEKGLTGQVKIVHLSQDLAEAALRRGDIDAYAGGYGPLEETRGFRVIDQAKNHPGMASTGLTIVRQDFLDAHPGFATAWNKGRVAGIENVEANLPAYYAQQAATAQLPVDIYRKLYPSTNFVTDTFPARGIVELEGTKEFLKSQHLLKNDFSIKDWLYHEGDGQVAAKQAASTPSS